MPRNRLIALACLAAVCVVLYMTLAARAPWSFLLPFRGTKLLALILVATSISTATLLFQTITQNRILTPSIMGFDALYVLIFTLAVFFLGSQAVMRLPPQMVFLVTCGTLVLAALLLFGLLLRRNAKDLFQLILTGIIFGVLFRSLTSFLQRMIDPNEFATIQVASYARFNDIETDLLIIAAPITVIALVLAWRRRDALDVIALGPDLATNLGEPPLPRQWEVLILIAVLVSVSTALVGPVAFLGLLVVSVTYVLVPSPHHRHLLPAAALVSISVLVGGQTILERGLSLSTPLSVIVDVLGGVVFLFLILKGKRI